MGSGCWLAYGTVGLGFKNWVITLPLHWQHCWWVDWTIFKIYFYIFLKYILSICIYFLECYFRFSKKWHNDSPVWLDSALRLPKERKMKAIGEKQVEVKGPGAGWWWILVTKKPELLVLSRYFSWWMHWWMHPILLKSQHLLPHQWINPFFAGKISMYCWSKKIFTKCACPHNPPPAGRF